MTKEMETLEERLLSLIETIKMFSGDSAFNGATDEEIKKLEEIKYDLEAKWLPSLQDDFDTFNGIL